MTDNDKLSFLDGNDGTETAAPAPEPAKVETPPPAQELSQPSTVETPPAAEPSTPPPGYIPLAAILDEREKRQAAERERDEFKRKVEEAAKQPEVAIDPITDTDAWVAKQNARIEKLEQDLTWKDAQRRAVRDFGADTVKAAFEALTTELQTNPAFYQTVERQSEPYEFVVKWHKRQQILAKMGDDDPDTYAEKLAKEKGWIIPERGSDGKFVAASPAPATPTPLPKPSLASAPAASGNAPKTPVGEGVAFGAVFKD